MLVRIDARIRDRLAQGSPDAVFEVAVFLAPVEGKLSAGVEPSLSRMPARELCL